MKHVIWVVALTIAATGFISAPAYATTYEFTVICPSRRFVVEWGIGSVDPGKEYLRGITGTKNAGCQIVDYNPQVDANLGRDRYSDWGGVVQGVPGIGIICGIFGC